MTFRIEDVHAENLRLIKQHNLKVGTIFQRKDEPHELATVKHIHKLYGWLITPDSCNLPQCVSDALDDWEVVSND